MHRVRNAECRPRMPAGSVERDAKTPRAECAMDDALVAGAVEGDHGMCVAPTVGEVVLRSAQVAQTFLAGRRHELDGPRGAQPNAVDLGGEGEHHGEPTAVVVDARADEALAVAANRQIGVTRKYRIEVGADDDGLELAGAVPAADHVAGAS